MRPPGSQLGSMIRYSAFGKFPLRLSRAHTEPGSEGSTTRQRFLRRTPYELFQAFSHRHLAQDGRVSRVASCIDPPLLSPISAVLRSALYTMHWTGLPLAGVSVYPSVGFILDCLTDQYFLQGQSVLLGGGGSPVSAGHCMYYATCARPDGRARMKDWFKWSS